MQASPGISDPLSCTAIQDCTRLPDEYYHLENMFPFKTCQVPRLEILGFVRNDTRPPPPTHTQSSMSSSLRMITFLYMKWKLRLKYVVKVTC